MKKYYQDNHQLNNTNRKLQCNGIKVEKTSNQSLESLRIKVYLFTCLHFEIYYDFLFRMLFSFVKCDLQFFMEA